MLTYLLVPALVLLPTWVSRGATDGRPSQERGERWRYSYLLSVLALVLFAGARLNVGTDYNFYQNVFREYDPTYWDYVVHNSPQEIGFTTGVLVLHTLTDNSRILFLVASLITVVCAAVAMRRMSSNFAISITLFILLGFYVAPFNILRQGLAVSLNFLAYSYLDKHKGRWLVLNVIASLIHSSAIYASVLQLLLRRVKPSWRLFAAMLLASLVLAAFVPHLGFLDFINNRYATYLHGQASGIGTYLYALSRAALVALLLVYRPRNGEIDRYIVLAMTGVCLLILGTQAEAISRLELYFGIYLVVGLPRILPEIPVRVRPVVVTLVVLGSLAFYVGYLSQFGDLVPYRFDWSIVGLSGPWEPA
jgi:hypothetical protein